MAQRQLVGMPVPSNATGATMDAVTTLQTNIRLLRDAILRAQDAIRSYVAPTTTVRVVTSTAPAVTRSDLGPGKGACPIFQGGVNGGCRIIFDLWPNPKTGNADYEPGVSLICCTEDVQGTTGSITCHRYRYNKNTGRDPSDAGYGVPGSESTGVCWTFHDQDNYHYDPAWPAVEYAFATSNSQSKMQAVAFQFAEEW